MGRSEVSFQCGELTLEGELITPKGRAGCPAVVVCHPHPLYGGNMDSPVVTGVCNRLEERGIASLRFNFRGTGRSTGAYAEGEGEQDDLKAALTFLENTKGVARDQIGVAGYSFGAVVGSKVTVEDDRIKALVAISLPPRLAIAESLQACTKPKLFIAGSNDHIVPRADLEKLVESLPQPKRCLIVDGADHYWACGLEEITKTAAEFFVEALKQA